MIWVIHAYKVAWLSDEEDYIQSVENVNIASRVTTYIKW